MVLGLVLLVQVLGVRCPSELSELQPLFLVNPFSLDQYLAVLSRRGQDATVSFVVETCMIVERSWIEWSRVARYRQILFYYGGSKVARDFEDLMFMLRCG